MKSLASTISRRPDLAAPVLLFLLLWVHGSLLGLSDDEAYYWVWAQRPALGYATHPPAVAWLIASFQFLLKWLFGPHSVALARLPAAFCSALVLYWALRWGRQFDRTPRRLWESAVLSVSFFGFFALSWMIVPDIPLLLGTTVLFVTSWKLWSGVPRRSDFIWLALGAAVVVLSKHSGILAVFSAVWVACLAKSKAERNRALISLGLGTLLGLIPTLVWNFQHEWAAILFQIRDRHGGDLSWTRSLGRFGRFCLVQFALVGPAILVFLGTMFRMGWKSDLNRYGLIWFLPPALVFGIQPFIGDFKAHWMIVAWWPVFLIFMILAVSRKSHQALVKFQIGYGAVISSIILLSCHFPLSGWLTKASDPRWDVTNDLYGWEGLEGKLKRALDPDTARLPVLGSRYQTASQAAFQLNGQSSGRQPVSLLPRGLKERDEWPSLSVVDSQGPEWPELREPVLFIGDNRYQGEPSFKNAVCRKQIRLTTYRYGLIAKWLDVWRCDPGSI